MSLVLTRKVGQALVITGGGIPPRRLYIVSVEGNTVRLAIDAPAQVNIVREELLSPEARRRYRGWGNWAVAGIATAFVLLKLELLATLGR